jgi:hypothetical protein
MIMIGSRLQFVRSVSCIMHHALIALWVTNGDALPTLRDVGHVRLLPITLTLLPPTFHFVGRL